MKKAQILSAIALAFALGVVAPIAGAASAIDHTAQTADCDEVSHVIEVVTKDGTYDKMLKLYNDAAKYTGTDTEADVKKDITDAMTALKNASVDVKNIPSTTASLSATIGAVNKDNVPNYEVYKGLYDAIKKTPQTSASLATFKEFIGKYNAIDGVTTKINDYSWTTWAAAMAAIKTTGTPANWDFDNYALYEDLFTAVDDANTFDEGMGVLESDLLALGVAQSAINGTFTLTARGGLASDTNIANYSKYVGSSTASVRVKLDAAGTCTEATAYGLIHDIADALKKADTQAYGADSVERVADILLGTVVTTPTPTDPTGPNDTNEPGDAEKPGDDTTPGNTGVVSSANGTASSTVAVVAGIATALTAAGAGVVAYRNARREA